MKYISTFLLIFIITGIPFLSAQAPSGLNYQAALRDAQGIILPNTILVATFEVRNGGINGQNVYQETQSLQTNEFGLLMAIIGEGNSDDDFSSIDWANGPYFLSVSVDLGNGAVDLGTTQLLSVPYALYARRAEFVDDADADPQNEIQNLSLIGNQLAISQGDTVDLTNLIEDADPDPANELQNISLDGSQLAITNGDTIDLSGLIEDADPDPNNEIQQLSLNNDQLSLSSANSVDLSGLADDADADPTNELQILSLNNTQLNISNGNSVNLSGLVGDADSDPTNEIQRLSFVGNNLSLSKGNTVNLGALAEDADADPNNEIQVLNLNGNNLSLSGSNSVSLAGLQGIEGTLANYAFATGTGSAPSSITRFLVNPAQVAITDQSQKVLIISNGLLGNNNTFTASANLDLYIGYRRTGTTTISRVPPGMIDCRIGANQRHNFGLSAMLTNLAPGTYEFGLAGDDDGNGNWNTNGSGYTTVLIFN